MTDLLNEQWELGDVVFGSGMPIDSEAQSSPGTYTWRTQDDSSPVGDGGRTGIDLIDPGSWNFQLFTNMEDEIGALEELARLALAWRADEVRKESGEVVPLRYRMANRTRRVYGRPRRFEAPLDNRLFGGYVPITCDFKTVSELFYSDEEYVSPEVGSLLPTTGGFTAPIVTPLTTETADVVRPYEFTVGGVMPTPYVLYEFTGPRTDAYLDVDGEYQVILKGTIPLGTTIIVDTRPWRMSIYRQDGGGMGNMLSRRTRLASLPALRPGYHTVSLGGSDPSGLSRARVRWREANPSV